jgi:spermidine synthase/Flp pilus assembly protein TadD
VLFDVEDHAADTRVYRKLTGEMHMSVDGRHIGGTEPNIVRKEKILAHLPMALRPDAESTLSVGLGSGITVGALAMYPGVKTLVCAEIVPGVVDGARLFAGANRDVMNDPRFDLVVGDGIQYLLTTRERFDIISSDSKLNPEYAGNAPLLSLDYYRLCRDRLTDDGIMVQWIAVHLPLNDVRIVARGFAEAFPYVGVYWYDPANIIFAGSKSPLVLDLDAIRGVAAGGELAADLEHLQLHDPYSFASLWLCDRKTLLERVGPAPVNTWERPVIEFTMGRNYLEKPRAYHEDDTMGWLLTLYNPASQLLSGEYDAAVLARYSASAGKLLEGFALGGGITRLQNALPIFRSALEENPDDPRLRALIATLDRMEGEIDEAVSADEMTTEGWVQAGLLRIDQGRPREALELFERALAVWPDDANIQYNRLLALKGIGDAEKFRADLTRFLAVFPDDARGLSLLGREQADGGDLATAVASFKRATELDPGSPVYFNNMAAALASLGRYEEAGRAFEEVCERNPRFQNAAFFAAASFSMANLPQDAAKWARFCIDEGLNSPDQFTSDPVFANLRASRHWDTNRNQPAP